MMQKTMQRMAPVTLVLAAYAVLSTSALIAQLADPEVHEDPLDAQTIPESIVPGEGGAEEVHNEGGGDAETGSEVRRVERPQRIRMEERNELKEQNRQQEEVGKLIEQQIERALDAGEDLPDFEAMKEQAKEQLFQAAESHAEQRGAMGSEHRVCFRADGSVTDNRQECDLDQSRHFGIREENPEQGGGEGFGYAPVSEESMQNHMEERFGQPAFASADLTGVVSEALERLSAMMGQMQGNPAAMAQIQQTMTFLSGVLRQQSAGQTPPPDTPDQIRMRLETVMQTVSSSSGAAGGRGPAGSSGPDMSRVLVMMEKMIPKLPQVIAIFEEAGIAVDPDARAAAEEAVATFARLRGPCGNGDMASCMQLGQVMGSIESRMRPPMERAMMSAGKPEVGMRIHALMDEEMGGMDDMERMGPPPGMQGNYGRPPEMFDPSQSREDVPHPYPMPPYMRGEYDPARGYEDRSHEGYPMPPGSAPYPMPMDGAYPMPSAGSQEGHQGQ